MGKNSLIAPLTSLRFFFALMVFASHLHFSKGGAPEGWKHFYDNVLREGYVGVSFFFALSGFVLAYSYRKKITEGRLSLSDFWIGRITRIYPLHFATLLLALPLVAWEAKDSIGNFLIKLSANLTLTHSLIPHQSVYFSFNAPSWSISTEMFFYLLFPFLMLLSHRSIKKGRFGVWMIIMAGILLIAMRQTPDHLRHALFYISPLSRICDFILGIALYFFYETARRVNFDPKFWGEIVAILIFATFLFIHPYVDQVYRYSIYYWLPILCLIGCFSLSTGPISKLLSRPFFVFLGEASFAFYLLHNLVIQYYSTIFKFDDSRGYQWILPILLTSISLSCAVYLLDRYFVKVMRSYITTLIQLSRKKGNRGTRTV